MNTGLEMTYTILLPLIWRFLICLVCTSSAYDYRELALDVLSEHCPYLDTCSQRAQQNFTYSVSKYMPCCQECLCSQLCRVEGNCCPDVGWNSSDDSGNLSEKVESLSREKCIQSSYPVKGGNGYSTYDMFKAIVTCPEDYPNNVIAEKCTRSEPESMEQVVLVSDGKGTIYRNIYCAQCNKAQDVDRWVLMISCQQITNPKRSFDFRISSIVQNKCYLISVPPAKLHGVLRKRCFAPNFSACNVTGDWKRYDEFTERACKTENATFIRFETVWKNVFCFLCNFDNPVNLNGHVCAQSLSYKKGLKAPPYSAILRVEVIDQDTARSAPEGCGLDEIYDRFFAKCRELICPPDAYPVNGKCRKAFQQTDGFPIKLYLNVTPAQSVDLAYNGSDAVSRENAVKPILTQVRNYLTQKLKRRKCGFCYTTVFTDASYLAPYILMMTIVSTPSCQLSYILGYIDELSKADVTVSVNTDLDVSTYVVQSIEYMDDALLDNYPSYFSLREYDLDICPSGDVHANAFKCPRVQVSGLDYIQALRSHYIKETPHYKRYNLSAYTNEGLAEITFEICVADYLPVMSSDGWASRSFGMFEGIMQALILLFFHCGEDVNILYSG